MIHVRPQTEGADPGVMPGLHGPYSATQSTRRFILRALRHQERRPTGPVALPRAAETSYWSRSLPRRLLHGPGRRCLLPPVISDFQGERQTRATTERWTVPTSRTSRTRIVRPNTDFSPLRGPKPSVGWGKWHPAVLAIDAGDQSLRRSHEELDHRRNLVDVIATVEVVVWQGFRGRLPCYLSTRSEGGHWATQDDPLELNTLSDSRQLSPELARRPRPFRSRPLNPKSHPWWRRSVAPSRAPATASSSTTAHGAGGKMPRVRLRPRRGSRDHTLGLSSLVVRCGDGENVAYLSGRNVPDR